VDADRSAALTNRLAEPVAPFVNGVTAAIRSRVTAASGIEELQAALADLLVGIWLRTAEDGTVNVRFVLRETEAVLGGRRSAEYTFPMSPLHARNLPALLERSLRGRIEHSTSVVGEADHRVEQDPGPDQRQIQHEHGTHG